MHAWREVTWSAEGVVPRRVSMTDQSNPLVDTLKGNTALLQFGIVVALARDCLKRAGMRGHGVCLTYLAGLDGWPDVPTFMPACRRETATR